MGGGTTTAPPQPPPPPSQPLPHMALEDWARRELDVQLMALQKCVYDARGSEQKHTELLRGAAAFTRLCGGVRVTCCKSGKDRTAMAVTLEATDALLPLLSLPQPTEIDHAELRQTREAQLERAGGGGGGGGGGGHGPGHGRTPANHQQSEQQQQQAQLLESMRGHGVRRENVRLNTGVDLFAFNSLQTSFLPAHYRPPPGSYGKNAS